MNVLLSTFAVGDLSALVPFVNLEAYLAGVAVLVGVHSVWTLAMTAAAGQVVGKVAWYEAGRSSVRCGMVRRTLESPTWGRTIARLHATMQQGSWTGVLMLALSAVLGIPPRAIMAVLVGQSKFPRPLVVAVLRTGRMLRFAVLLHGVSLLKPLVAG